MATSASSMGSPASKPAPTLSCTSASVATCSCACAAAKHCTSDGRRQRIASSSRSAKPVRTSATVQCSSICRSQSSCSACSSSQRHAGRLARRPPLSKLTQSESVLLSLACARVST